MTCTTSSLRIARGVERSPSATGAPARIGRRGAWPITAQRAYEMNSKVVTTADQMLSTTSQMKS